MANQKAKLKLMNRRMLELYSFAAGAYIGYRANLPKIIALSP